MPIPASQAPLASAMGCNSVPAPGPPQRPKTAAPFEDEHLSRLLQRLLQSKNPRDIQNANQLIKAMVRQVSFFTFMTYIVFLNNCHVHALLILAES